ncbi:MAG: DUF4169 family protein [Hyphomicrobiales bacterium]
MVEIVNLRQARKRKERGDRARTADENRARFGRSKAESKLGAAQRALDKARHSAHKRDEDDDG